MAAFVDAGKKPNPDAVALLRSFAKGTQITRRALRAMDRRSFNYEQTLDTEVCMTSNLK